MTVHFGVFLKECVCQSVCVPLPPGFSACLTLSMCLRIRMRTCIRMCGEGCGYRAVARCLPVKCKVLSSIAGTEKKAFYEIQAPQEGHRYMKLGGRDIIFSTL